MAILTHGSDLTLAPALAPVVRHVSAAGGTVRGALDVLRRAGFAAVQLDAALPGLRPRELDRRARKDLVALLGRDSVRLAGIDLFIPRRHFLEPAHLDRAMAATLAALELAADLGRVPVCVALPVAAMSADSKAVLVEAADGHSVRLAVHAEDQLDALLAWTAAVDLPALGAALDPAAALASGGDPVAAVHRLSDRLAVARLSDVAGAFGGGGAGFDGSVGGEDSAANVAGMDPAPSPSPAPLAGGGIRCAVGEGELDVASYRIALDLASRRAGPVVLDLRGLPEPAAAAGAAKGVWERAAYRA